MIPYRRTSRHRKSRDLLIKRPWTDFYDNSKCRKTVTGLPSVSIQPPWNAQLLRRFGPCTFCNRAGQLAVDGARRLGGYKLKRGDTEQDSFSLKRAVHSGPSINPFKTSGHDDWTILPTNFTLIQARGDNSYHRSRNAQGQASTFKDYGPLITYRRATSTTIIRPTIALTEGSAQLSFRKRDLSVSLSSTTTPRINLPQNGMRGGDRSDHPGGSSASRYPQPEHLRRRSATTTSLLPHDSRQASTIHLDRFAKAD
ncbi:MAG: hypothetical protein J3Q66DRAFT_370089 [Benniella sp.]|nr:MAG: hypothetical protein J3Q66DRAFT_370089 [Benniella sp.]